MTEPSLSIRMIGVLESGSPSTNSARVIGHAGTLNALRRRGLIGDDNRWTALGRQVAASTLSSRVYTIDELHEQAQRLYDEARCCCGEPDVYDGYATCPVHPDVP